MDPTPDLSTQVITTPSSDRPRARNGQFLQSRSSTRSPQALAKQRARQKECVARRRRMTKRLVCSFVREIIIKDDGNEHWIPAAMDSGIIFDLMDSLFKDIYHESRRSRLSALKTMYFKGDPRKSTEHLPRLRARDANLLQSTGTEFHSRKLKPVPAFVGWRFPFAVDSYEMEGVKKWLRDHKRMLKVGITEAMGICVHIFNRYVKCADKYLYYGYPLQIQNGSSSSGFPLQATASERPMNVNSAIDSASAPASSSDASPEQQGAQGIIEQAVPELPRIRMTEYANRIMTAAKDDILYRSLRVTLFPSSEVQFSVLCHAWVTEFCNGKPSEDWCALQKDLFEYCLQTTQGRTHTAEYQHLRQYLSDQHEVLSLVRQSAGLPLYDNDDWYEVDSG